MPPTEGNVRRQEEELNRYASPYASNPVRIAIQRQLLDIRTREAAIAGQTPQQTQSPPSFTSISHKRPFHVIDLTEDSESEYIPRKKSYSSSSDSSDRSIRVVGQALEPATEVNNTYEESLLSSGVLPNDPERNVSRARLQKASNESQNPFQEPQSQYASAVVVRSTPQPSPRPKPTSEDIQIRREFLRNLRVVPNITLTNNIDNSSPPLGFRFVTESVLREGVEKVDEAFMSGCGCRKKRGSNECKYPNECQCLQDSAGEVRVKRGQYHDTGLRRGCLVKGFLMSRFHVFECNSKCDCSQACKNRVVQHGRKIGLELFKTRNRGWGLKTKDHVQQGQFIDTYRGEIITQDEADQRSEGRGADKDNYLYDFDKFPDPLYVCDGEHIGGPTRFMNHSCDPNCAMFTVSFNHADTNIYELAFFAKEAIPAGTELTFDYQEEDEEVEEDDDDDDDVQGGMTGKMRQRITDEMAARMEREKGYAPTKCKCGSDHCRGYFFYSKEKA